MGTLFEVKQITHFHLVPRLTMSGAIPPHRHAPSWNAQENLYFIQAHGDIRCNEI
jgi:hypothetical protein